MFQPPLHHLPEDRPGYSNGLYPAFHLSGGVGASVGIGAPMVPLTSPLQLRGGLPRVIQGGHYHVFPPCLPSSLVRPSAPPRYNCVNPSPLLHPRPPLTPYPPLNSSPLFNACPPLNSCPPTLHPRLPPLPPLHPCPPHLPPKEPNFPSAPNSASAPAPAPPPPMPKDLEMLKNIEVTSFFVVKNGPEFETMARAKQACDPKFSFLFGGAKGTDAALGFDFYNWKKQHLAWIEGSSNAPHAEYEKVTKPNSQEQLNDIAQVVPAAEALSPGEGSDMDMEDDFAPIGPNGDKDPTLDRSAAILVALGEAKSGRPSTSPQRTSKTRSPATQDRLDMSSQVPEKKRFRATDSTVSEFTMGHKGNASNEREFPSHKTNRGFSNQESRLDGHASGGSNEGNTQRSVKDLSYRGDVASEEPKRRDTRRKTGFDRPRMEKISEQGSPPTSRVRQHTESNAIHDLDRKESFRNGRTSSGRPSRWASDSSSDRLGKGASHLDKEFETNAGDTHGQGEKMVDSFAQVQSREDSTKVLRSTDVKRPGFGDSASTAKNHEKVVPKSGSDQPAVDEFGRLLRQGGSDSDADENHHGVGTKRRRISSRSRSRSMSPSSTRFRRRSPGHSPPRRGRRSRSRSRSPRRNRSHSRSPPRWAEGRGDRGGRRGGRSGPGQPSLCHDFVRGKCFRGSSCKYSHDESSGTGGDLGGRWNGGRGRDREQDRSGAPAEERDRNWGSRSGDDAKLRKQSQFDIRAKDEGSRDVHTSEAKQKAESRTEDSSKQGTGFSLHSTHPPGTENYSPVAPSEFSPKMKGRTSPHAPPSHQPQGSVTTRFPPAPSQQSVPTNLRPSHASSSLIQNSSPGGHKLGNLVSPPVCHQHSFMVSPSQHLQFPPPYMSQSQQTAFPMVSQLPKPPFQPSSSMHHTSGFSVNASTQQPAFSPALNVLSASPSLPTLAPSFASSAGPQPSLLNASQPNPSFVSPQPPPMYKGSQGPPLFNVSQPPLSYSPSVPPASSSSQQSPSFNPSQLPPPFIASHPPSSFASSQPPPVFNSSQPSLSFSLPLPPPFQMSQQQPNPSSFVSSSAGSFNSGTQITSFPISGAQFQPPAQPPKLSVLPGQSLPPGTASHWIPSTAGPSVSLAAPPSQPIPQSFQQGPPPPSSVPHVSTGSYSYSSVNFAVPPNNAPPRPAPLKHEQYDPLADSLEPVASGSLDQNDSERRKLDQRGFLGSSKNSLEVKPHSTSQPWSSNAVDLPGSLMTNAGEVVLENVSPGLPGHVNSISTATQFGRVSNANAHPEVSIEDLSPTTASPTHGEDTNKLEGTEDQMVMENVSPPTQQNNTGTVLTGDEEKKRLKEVKVLNLVRKAVTDQVKELLKPSWKGGNMSKEAFKTIAKKAVDKVTSALENKGQIPKSSEKLEAFMKTSRPKIAKLVQGYIDKYGRA